MDIRTITYNYYTELAKGFKTRSLDTSKLPLAEKVSIIGPDKQFDGKETVEKMFTGFVGLVSTCDIIKQYFDEDSACTIINFISKDGSRSVLTAEIITVKYGEIVQMKVIYDTKQWASFVSVGF